jgi:hypothetical protein
LILTRFIEFSNVHLPVPEGNRAQGTPSAQAHPSEALSSDALAEWNNQENHLDIQLPERRYYSGPEQLIVSTNKS